jgi:[acyl-carrier-protein] S-malonyltransferase
MGVSPCRRVVKVRAESMAAAAKVGDHGMLSVVGLADDVLQQVCDEARAKIGADCVCQIANYLFPQGRVVSGDKAALEEVTRLATAKGALKCATVAVSGAFHTSRMAWAHTRPLFSST